MERVLALKNEKAEHIEAMQSLVDTSEKAGKPLEGDNLAAWENHLKASQDLDSRIKTLETTSALKSTIDKVDEPGKAKATPETKDKPETFGFKNIGEMLHAVAYRPNDDRLQAALDMNVGESGGYMVPTEFRDSILSVGVQDAIIRPRATVIEPGDMPDAAVEFPALNQNSTENMFGGVEMKWTKSGTTKPETDLKLRKVRLEPQETAGFIEVTDQLLRNWSAASTFIETQFRLAALAQEDLAFLSGDGVAKPMGVLNSAAKVAPNRATANDVEYADLTAMYSKAKFGGSLVWVMNQSVLPKLLQLESTLGQLIYQPSVSAGVPGMIFGAPVVFNERNPQLGSLGDIGLYDFSYYMIKDGSGPFIAASEHVKFKDNITVIKFFRNLDGQSWLTEPISQEGGYQVSPFVPLDVPA